MILEQSKGRRKKIFKLDETGILITSIIKGKLPNEEHIPYENIRSDRFSYTAINYTYLIFAGIGLVLLTIGLSSEQATANGRILLISLWGAGSIISIIFFFVHRPTAYFLKTFSGKFIRFLNTQDKVEIESFVKSAIAYRNDYLRFKYSTPIPYLDYQQQHSNLDVLLRDKIISKAEYEEKLTQLKIYFQQQQATTTNIGYSDN